MKSMESSRFKMRPELFSSLTCVKFNHAIETLSARDDWDNILTKCIKSTRGNLSKIVERESIEHEGNLIAMKEVEKSKLEEQIILEREISSWSLNPELVPIDKKTMNDANLRKWKLIKRNFTSGKDGRSLSHALYERSLICYYHQVRFIIIAQAFLKTFLN